MNPEQTIVEYLRPRRRVLITSHARPDGDSIGSQLALALGLEQIGKKVEVVNVDPHPPNYRTLPGIDRIRLQESVNGEWDCVVLLECNNLERSGVRGLERYPAVNIDHHPSNDHFGVVNWVDPNCAAVAEMVFPILRGLGVRITPEIATNLYVGILTDTGSFRFSNTTPQTFRTAAELVEAGADPAATAEEVLMRQSESRLRLMAALLNTFGRDPSGRIAWVTLTRKMLEETGAAANDTEGLVNYPLSVDGVEVCVFLREEADGSSKVSLRSKGGIDVGRVAEAFGGGGHRNASGFSFPGGVEEAHREVVERLLPLLESPAAGRG
ncbi:MAG: bifunctional oligoribonuclease/PAP phosphatase NrnA [Acidobacteriota bacterium]